MSLKRRFTETKNIIAHGFRILKAEIQSMAQKADKSLYNSSTKFLSNYFEIIVREAEDDILFKPPLKNK